EIARVLLGRQDGQWTGLIYGGIFPDAESRMGAPEAIFSRTPYFAREDAQQSDPRDPARQVFQAPWLSFEYPSDAEISLASDLPGPNAVAIVAESYRIDLQPLDATVDQLLDNWAFDWYPANVDAYGGPAVAPSLVQYSTEFAVNNAYQ